MGWRAAIVAIIVALVGPGGVVAVMVTNNRKLRDENSEQHAEGRALVAHVSRQLSTLHDHVVDMDGRHSDQLGGLQVAVADLKNWQHTHELEHVKAAAAEAKVELKVIHGGTAAPMGDGVVPEGDS